MVLKIFKLIKKILIKLIFRNRLNYLFRDLYISICVFTTLLISKSFSALALAAIDISFKSFLFLIIFIISFARFLESFLRISIPVSPFLIASLHMESQLLLLVFRMQQLHIGF